MFRIFVTATAIAAGLTTANAQAEKPRINVEMHNVERAGAIINVLFKADNMGAIQARSVLVRCTLFDKDQRALDSAIAAVSDLPGGAAKYGKVMILRKANDTKFAACDVDNAV